MIWLRGALTPLVGPVSWRHHPVGHGGPMKYAVWGHLGMDRMGKANVSRSPGHRSPGTTSPAWDFILALDRCQSRADLFAPYLLSQPFGNTADAVRLGCGAQLSQLWTHRANVGAKQAPEPK